MTIEAGHRDDGEGDNSVLVAEYVLGLLDAAEHQRVAALIAAHPALRSELRMWQDRLQGFDSEYAEVAAPPAAWTKIESRLFGTPEANTVWDSLILWRGLFAGALAVAVVAIGVNVSRPLAPSPDELATQLVAALQSQEGSGVEFVAFYDTTNKAVRLLGLSGATVPDKDYELWYINPNEAPVSMGVIPVDARSVVSLSAAAQQKIAEGTTLAVTLEQKGGSPTGAPQGVLVSAGPALKI